MNQLRALLLDIETSPIVALVWDIKDQYISPDQILKDWDIMAWSAKWLGEPKSHVYYDRRKGLSDKQILKPLWELLNEADVVITQNGKAFDAKKINARFMIHGFLPPRPYKHIDTYLLNKGVAAFTSHSLAYIAKVLKTKHKKLTHPKYPGLSLWKECLSLKILERPWKNPKAWDEMKLYNKVDVLTTEDVYNSSKAWGPQNMPRLYNVPLKCSICGSTAQRRGRELKGKTLVQRVRCQNPSCGKWGTEALPKGDKK